MPKSFRLLVVSCFMYSGLLASSAVAEEVYMIRGFLNVFSDGMNQMTRQLNAR